MSGSRPLPHARRPEASDPDTLTCGKSILEAAHSEPSGSLCGHRVTPRPLRLLDPQIALAAR